MVELQSKFILFQTLTLEDVDDYMLTAAIHPAQVSNNDLKYVRTFFKLFKYNRQLNKFIFKKNKLKCLKEKEKNSNINVRFSSK